MEWMLALPPCTAVGYVQTMLANARRAFRLLALVSLPADGPLNVFEGSCRSPRRTAWNSSRSCLLPSAGGLDLGL